MTATTSKNLILLRMGNTTICYPAKTMLQHIISRNLIEQLPEAAIPPAFEAIAGAPPETVRRFRTYLEGVTVPTQDELAFNNLIVAVDGVLEAHT